MDDKLHKRTTDWMFTFNRYWTSSLLLFSISLNG